MIASAYIYIYMKYETHTHTHIYIYTYVLSFKQNADMGLLPLCCHVVQCVSVCVSSCNWLKLETTAQLTHAGKVFGTFWGNSYMHLFCQAILLSYRASKKLLQWLNKHWNTTCSEYVHAGCVTHVKNTTGLSKASNHTIKSHTNPVKLGVLRVLWQFKNYSTIQNHWEPKRAENTVKKSKKTKLWATCDYLPSLIVFCLWFLWGFAGGPPLPDPKGFLQYTSPI